MGKNSPGSVRPTSTRHLSLARAAALGSASSAAIAVAIGTWSDAAAAGGAAIAIPFVLGAVIGLGLAGAWHVLLGYAAHAREVHERSLAAAIAGALALVGIGCSGWFLALLIGGQGALQAYQLEQIDRFDKTAVAVVANEAAETPIMQSVSEASAALENTAADEARLGIIGGKAGKGVVYATLNGAAKSFADKAAALQKQSRLRDEALGRFRDAISAAEQASAAHDATAFQDDMAHATDELTAAASVRLSIADLASGLQTRFAEDPVRRAITDVTAVTDDAARRLRHVDVPHYAPISAREAIIRNPQPLAWIAAVLIELIPTIFVTLLLTIWRDDESQAPPSAPAEATPDITTPARRPSLVAAE